MSKKQDNTRIILRGRRVGQRALEVYRFDDAERAHSFLLEIGGVRLAKPSKDKHGHTVYHPADLESAAKLAGFDWHEFSFLPLPGEKDKQRAF